MAVVSRRAFIALSMAASSTYANPGVQEVAMAGLAYSGDAATLAQRFPYSRRYEESLKSSGQLIYQKISEAIAVAPPKNFALKTDIGELKGRDQAIVSSLVLNSETVSVERFGEIRKLFVLIRGQAMFFDFKAKAVIRSYPISFAYVDNFNRDPSEREIQERVRFVFEGASGKPGLIARFAAVLSTAVVPEQAKNSLQVSKVVLAPELLSSLPAYLKSTPSVSETWAADIVAEAISTRVGVPLIPYSKGYAVGNVMSLRISDGEVFDLKLPAADYEIHVDFKGFKKIQYSQSGAGASYIYGSYADILVHEPLTATAYLRTSLKNGEVKVVPASQSFVDDFPAFYDSLNGMFVKLAQAVAGKDNTWVKTAASAPDIEAQISKTKALMDLCK